MLLVLRGAFANDWKGNLIRLSGVPFQTTVNGNALFLSGALCRTGYGNPFFVAASSFNECSAAWRLGIRAASKRGIFRSSAPGTDGVGHALA
jgi:hypothetical protein